MGALSWRLNDSNSKFTGSTLGIENSRFSKQIEGLHTQNDPCFLCAEVIGSFKVIELEVAKTADMDNRIAAG